MNYCKTEIMKDYKVQLTILDGDDKHQASTIIPLQAIKIIKQIHNVDVVSQQLEFLVDGLEEVESPMPQSKTQSLICLTESDLRHDHLSGHFLDHFVSNKYTMEDFERADVVLYDTGKSLRIMKDRGQLSKYIGARWQQHN